MGGTVGVRLGGRTIATKYFERYRQLDMVNFIAWQMLIGILPIMVIPLIHPLPPAAWSATYALLLFYSGAISTAIGFLVWIAVLRWLPAGTASLNMLLIPLIALLSSMAAFDERLTSTEWLGIGCIGIGLAIISLRAWRASRRGEHEIVEAPAMEGG